MIYNHNYHIYSNLISKNTSSYMKITSNFVYNDYIFINILEIFLKSNPYSNNLRIIHLKKRNIMQLQNSTRESLYLGNLLKCNGKYINIFVFNTIIIYIHTLIHNKIINCIINSKKLIFKLILE